MAAIIIEEISRNHKLIGRHKFQQASVNIGRGYQNDIILTDPHVCADHLSIHFDGEHWFIRDLGSVNGSFMSNSKQPADQHKIKSGDIVAIGNSQIRLVFPDHPIEASLLISPFESLINFVRHPIVLISAILLFSIINAYLIHISSATDLKAGQLLAQSLKTSLTFALWPIGLTLVSLLSKNEPRFWAQVGVCFIFFSIFRLFDFTKSIVLFNASSHSAFDISLLIISMALTYCVFWLNTYVGFQMSSRRRIWVSAGLVTLLFGGSMLMKLGQQQDYYPLPRYDSTILPPSYLLTSGSSIDEFINDAEEIFEAAKKQAEK